MKVIKWFAIVSLTLYLIGTVLDISSTLVGGGQEANPWIASLMKNGLIIPWEIGLLCVASSPLLIYSIVERKVRDKALKIVGYLLVFYLCILPIYWGLSRLNAAINNIKILVKSHE